MVPEVEVLLHADDVADVILVVLLEQLQKSHLCHRLNCGPNDWLV